MIVAKALLYLFIGVMFFTFAGHILTADFEELPPIVLKVSAGISFTSAAMSVVQCYHLIVHTID